MGRHESPLTIAAEMKVANVIQNKVGVRMILYQVGVNTETFIENYSRLSPWTVQSLN